MTDTFPRALRQALAETSAPPLDGAGFLPYLDDHSGAAGARALAVVRPGDAAEVATVLKLAHRQRVPVATRGAGTGLSGGATAVDRCPVLSTDDAAAHRPLVEVDSLSVAFRGRTGTVRVVEDISSPSIPASVWRSSGSPAPARASPPGPSSA